MEKNIRTSGIDIVIRTQEGSVVFEIKDPKQLNRALLNDIKQDFFLIQKESIVICPEQKIIDSRRVYIEDISRFI